MRKTDRGRGESEALTLDSFDPELSSESSEFTVCLDEQGLEYNRRKANGVCKVRVCSLSMTDAVHSATSSVVM